MSDTVLIVLIVTAAVVFVLFMIRKQLREFALKASRDGFETSLKTDPSQKDAAASPAPARRPGGTRISGNRQVGLGNQIEVDQANAEVTDNLQAGEENVIATHAPAARKPKKK